MNLLRNRNPELRPSTNTSIGRVIVPDPEQLLTEKTDRTGFLETPSFINLRRFARDSLEWMARQRVAERDAGKQTKKIGASKATGQARRKLTFAVDALPAPERETIRSAVKQFETARQKEERILREDLQLYRTLASLGTTIAVFAHEAAKPVGQIEQMAASIQRRGQEALGTRYSDTLGRPVQVIAQSAKALQSYASFPLTLLRQEKRRSGEVEVGNVIKDIVQLFAPFLEDAKISCKVVHPDENYKVWGSVAAFESIMSNLITNAVNAFVHQDKQVDDRQLQIRTSAGDGQLVISVADNGPGLIGLSADEAWLAGRTSTPGGTGLGLTIVRDTVIDLGGQANAIPHGELGGAEIVVTIPLLEVEQ